MKSSTTWLIASIALALPIAAFAQSNTADANYCSALSDDYERYALGRQEHKGHRDTTPNVALAMTKCQSDTAAAIPVLEKALTDAKVPLPPRS
jgi:hypothetical protein